MSNPSELQSMVGQTAVDTEGAKIGKIGQIYLDDQSGQPVWVTVHTGMFGTKESFAPLFGSSVRGDDLVLAVTKDLVKGAPSVDADGHTSDEENDALYNYYAGYLGTADAQTKYAGGDAATDGPDRVGHDTSGPNTDDAMTRSEERLRVGTEKVEGGRARLRKYVVTENVTQTVPISHEEVRIEREPITDANRDQAMAGGDITEEEHEVILTAERPAVQKETVPVERVRLSTETVTEDHEVSETLRKEQIDETPEVVTDARKN
ncbi:MAG: uncharacterized protein JWN95_1850 [Frankiales bacterium]|nr:uncharacterized protein [Frankiales bacterium]